MSRSISGLAVRTYARFVVPLTILAVVACAPIVWYALRARVPADAVGARGMLRFTIAVGATAWIWQLILAGAAAVMAEGVAAGAPLSQLAALRRGLVGLLRAVVPCLAAAAAIAVGGLALVVPGLVLLVLLSLTGASHERGVPAALVDSIAAARLQLRATAVVAFAIVALDLAIVWIARVVLTVPLPKKPPPLQLIGYPRMLVVAVVAIVLVSPLVACVLAALRHHARPADQSRASQRSIASRASPGSRATSTRGSSTAAT